MKKIFVTAIFLICTIICINANAENVNERYIVKVKNSSISLMCLNDGIEQIGNNLFCAQNLETIYDLIPGENIEMVFPDYEFELFELDYPAITSDVNFASQWYLDKVSADSARKKGLSGAGIKIAVIDSGINFSHPDFNQENILHGYNCIVGAEDKNDYSDNVGHGTMVSGIIAAQTDNELGIAGIASNAQIIPIKITDSNSLSLSNIFCGLEKALETDCDIINMSFGGAINDEDALDVLKSYIDKAEEKGIVVVAAVGNSGHIDNVINYPAGFESVIGVGSVDEDLNVSYFSQKNSSVFLAAPGESIISLSSDNSVAYGVGTSMSAPIVTAVIATIKGVNKEYKPQDIRDILMRTSDDMGDSGYDLSYGYGVLNVENIIQLLGNQIPDFVISEGVLNSELRIHFHNNSGGNVISDAVFVKYENGTVDNIKIIKDINLISGLTSINCNESYHHVFLWDKNLRPLSEKYNINLIVN